nr:YVTN family beta-propeller repeat protein [Chelatococcus sambhunathii]
MTERDPTTDQTARVDAARKVGRTESPSLPEGAWRLLRGTAGSQAKRQTLRRMRRALAAASLGFAASVTAATPGESYEVFVTNERDDTVSVIDVDQMAVARTFKVGRRPRGLTFSPDGKTLYVCASDSNSVQAIDPASGKLLHDLPSGEDPEQFSLSPDGRRLFIANEDDALTTVVDVETRKVMAQIEVGIEPEGMAVSPDGALAVTTSETTNMVHWIDVPSLTSSDATPVGQRPRHAEFDLKGEKLWVSSEVGGTVAIIDVATKQVVHTIEFKIPGIAGDRIQPVGVQLTRDGKLAFVALGPSDRVAVVDAQTYQVKSYILVGRRVWHLALTPEQDMLFTTNGVSGDVTIIDVASLKPVKTIKVGRFPWGAAVRPKARPVADRR